MEIRIEDPKVREAVNAICAAARDAGGRAVLIGGAVRDAALGLPAKDIDIEVFGLAAPALERLLAERFPIDAVGEAFGVIKIHGLPIDVSLPRRESKAGLGHKGFMIHSDPTLPHREAAARRDFTINAIACDPLSGEVIDPFDGLGDLRRRILRHTSAKFSEDPLRVLRGMQFAGRFDAEVAAETVALCRSIEPEGLARERIFDEWKKLILRGVRPSRGLAFLRACGWVRYYPELEALIDCVQDPLWHPEGDVWIHTLHAMDAFAEERANDPEEDLIVGLAVLCHDLGKPSTTARERGRIRSLGHEQAGEGPARTFLGRLTNQGDLIDAIVPLVTHHLRPQQLHEAGASAAAIRRLARNVGRIDRLVRVARADRRGRPGVPPEEEFEAGRWLIDRARDLAVKDAAPEPIVKGRHLIDLGLEPGPHFGPILEACYEAQLDGEFETIEEGIARARAMIEGRAGRDDPRR